jgi:tetratricopeptide (TPR) repeat protein
MTTQARSPRGAQSCIVDARILAHLVYELQPRRVTMRRYAILFALVSLFLPLTVFAQTPEAAVNHFKNAIKKSGAGDLDGAIEDYTRAITLSSNFGTPKKGSTAVGNSFTGSADAPTEEITIVDPFTANAYSNRGLLRYQKGDYTGAIDDFNRALRIKPSLALAYLNRAAALNATGDPAAALKDLDKAIALDKDLFQAYNNRGMLNLDAGNHKAALADLNRAVELNDKVADTFYYRGTTQLALTNFDAAIADYDRAIKLDPTSAWGYQGRGTALMGKGVMLRAKDDFTRAIELNPKIAWAYFNRGLIWVFMGDESKAENDFAECLKLKPELKPELNRRVSLARALNRIGQPPE